MQILKDSSTITQTVPRIVETPDYLIINGQVHDKVTFKPIPLEFNIVNTPLLYSSFNQCIWTHDNIDFPALFLHYGNNKNQKIYQDSEDPNIFYILFKYSNYGIKLIKFKKEENNIQEIWNGTWNYSPSALCGSSYRLGNDINILYQSDLYIVFLLKYSYHANNWDSGANYHLYKYNKKTNQISNIIEYNYNSLSNYQFMEYYNDNVYLYRQDNNTYYIYKLNLSTNILSTLFTYTNTNGLTIIDNPIKIDDYYYIIKDNFQNSGLHEYCFCKIRLDVSTDTVSQDFININLNGFILDTAPGEVLSGIGECVYHTLKVLKSNSKNYIICTIHSIPNANYYPNQHKNIVFEVKDNELIVKDVKIFPNGCKGVLEYIDTNTLVFLYSNGLSFYKFDNVKEKYIKTYTKAGIFNTIGFDTLNRLYMQHDSNAIEVVTSMNACILKADFTKEYYTAINTDTEISFYAKNFLDEYINTDVKITLLGPVIFKDDKSKQKITKTSDTGINTLPVIITGSGRIEVIITQLT